MTGGRSTDISVDRDATTITLRHSATGDQVAMLPAAGTQYAGLMTAADRARLTGVGNLGTVSAAVTVTLDIANGGKQYLTCNHAFTLAPQAQISDIDLEVTMGASAGAIDAAGYDMVVGSFDSTQGDVFDCLSRVNNSKKILYIQACQ